MKMSIGSQDGLIVVDVQNDFLPGGALAVTGGDAVIPVINAFAPQFQNVVLTQDWHPAGHISFATTHPGAEPFSTKRLDYGEQVLWPDHCVIGSPGAEFAHNLDVTHAQAIIRKGFHPNVDSYSGFREADRKTPTGLEGYLRERGIKRLFIVGLATDFCVNWTAQDAAAAGFETIVLEDACRAIDQQGSLERAWADMQEAGVKRSASDALVWAT